MSKKGYDGVLWSVLFLRKPLPSFCILPFWFEQKAWPLGATSDSAVDIAHLPCFECH